MSIKSIALSLAILSPFTQAAEKPNILFILADDLGYGDLGYTGSSQIKTPNIDKLAGEGVVCSRAYVTAPFCGPSRAAILTGRYQQRFGYEFNPDAAPHIKPEWLGLPTNEKTLGNHMQDAGYTTAAIGKWHMGYTDNFYPTNRGFDYFFGMRGGGHSYFPSVTEKRPGWYPHFSIERMGKLCTEVEVPYLTDWFTKDACSFMKIQKASDKPWMLYLAYNCPHGPLEAKQEDIEKYKHIGHKGRRTYCAMVDNLDQNIGKLLETLKTTGQDKNTVIIFLNDNGGSVETVYALNAPYWGTKGTFYEGGLRVPMFIHYPKLLKAGTYKHSVSGLDIIPTCLALAGQEFKLDPRKKGKKEFTPITDGINLLPYLTEDNKTVPHQKLFWRVMFRGGSMVDGDWKMIQTPHSLPQLFNLATDPGEQTNLASKHPEKLATMFDQYFTWSTTFERSPMWMDAPFWQPANRQIHRKKYQLTQP